MPPVVSMFVNNKQYFICPRIIQSALTKQFFELKPRCGFTTENLGQI